MSGRNSEFCFKPGHLYPLECVADILDVSHEWVRDNLIYSGDCTYKKQGRVYVFRGEWLLRWASDEFNDRRGDEDPTPVEG